MKKWALLCITMLVLASAAIAKVGGGDVLFTVKGAGKVLFSHDAHVGNAGLGCKECHDKMYVTKEKHKKATMAEMKKGKSCGSCHNGKRAFDVKGNCESCHAK
ncbi:MAG: cytochrome c3 family protein [Deltaproteobacteria bacterium]|nr:cytochrome c3 family protein [Deltaproteobacteria bacterium]